MDGKRISDLTLSSSGLSAQQCDSTFTLAIYETAKYRSPVLSSLATCVSQHSQYKLEN